MTEQLAADPAMGPVTLNVADLDGMTAYYRDAVGLPVAIGPEHERIRGVNVHGPSPLHTGAPRWRRTCQ